MTQDDPLHETLIAFEGRPDGPGRAAEDPVSPADIRRWREAFGAGPGEAAPHAMLAIFTTRGYRETLAQAEAGTGLFRLLTAEGYITPGVALEHSYAGEIRPGDRVRERSIIERISPRKITRRGAGYFVTRRTEYSTADGRTLGTQRLTVLAFKAEKPPATDRAAPPSGALPGDALPPREIRLDRLGVIACTAACSDYYAGHYDPDVARALGFADIFTDIQTALGFAQLYVADHAGPVRSIALRLGAPYYAGDTLTLTGAREEGTVRFRGTCNTGLHLEGEARL